MRRSEPLRPCALLEGTLKVQPESEQETMCWKKLLLLIAPTSNLLYKFIYGELWVLAPSRVSSELARPRCPPFLLREEYHISALLKPIHIWSTLKGLATFIYISLKASYGKYLNGECWSELNEKIFHKFLLQSLIIIIAFTFKGTTCMNGLTSLIYP